MATADIKALAYPRSAGEALKYQEDQLKSFIRLTRGSVSYYGNQFERLIASESFFHDRWREMPILTKYNVRDEFDRLVAVNPPMGTGEIKAEYTTGSTGTPIKILRTGYADAINSAMNARMFREWKLDGDKTFLVQFVRNESDGNAFKLNRTWHPDGGSGNQGVVSTGSIDEHLERVSEMRPAYLKSYPQTIAAQAERVRETGADISFELVLSNGSVLPDWVRDICDEVFGAPILDLYGTKEAGLIGYECLECGEIHLLFDNVLTELIRDDGEPAEPGETGRVIVTPFHNIAMPLIRFDLGDQAVRGTGGDTCSDQPLTIKSIIGRTKSNFVRPDGSIFAPRMSHKKAVEAGIKRYRIVQTELNKVEMNYYPVETEIAPDADLIDLLKGQIGVEFQYTLNRVERVEDLNHPKLLTFESLLDPTGH